MILYSRDDVWFCRIRSKNAEQQYYYPVSAISDTGHLPRMNKLLKFETKIIVISYVCFVLIFTIIDEQ